eukprot:4716260-Pyramimonas_sp.AAC.2
MLVRDSCTSCAAAKRAAWRAKAWQPSTTRMSSRFALADAAPCLARMSARALPSSSNCETRPSATALGPRWALILATVTSCSCSAWPSHRCARWPLAAAAAVGLAAQRTVAMQSM